MDLSGFEPEASSMPRRRSSGLIYKPEIISFKIETCKTNRGSYILRLDSAMISESFYIAPWLYCRKSMICLVEDAEEIVP